MIRSGPIEPSDVDAHGFGIEDIVVWPREAVVLGFMELRAAEKRLDVSL